MGKIGMRTAVRFTKTSVYLAHSWPPPRNTARWKIIKLEIVWYASISSSLGLLVPLLVSIYKRQSSSLVLTQSACFVGAICNFIVKMLVYRIHRERTRVLVNEMEEFLRNAKEHESRLVERYVDTFFKFHAVITLVNYMTAVIVIGATIDCQTALIMWYAGARLELLSLELEGVSSTEQFREFVGKHQRLLSYAKEASATMSYIALTTWMMSGLGTIFSGLQLMSNQPLAVKMQFGPVVLVAGMNLFVCSWPADNLIKVCDLMGMAVYDSSWVDASPRARTNYLMILQRSQLPVTVSIGGFLPALSLRSYAMYLSTAFSYTTGLRLVVNAESENYSS